MKQNELGRTGLRVSEIAFGGVEIGMPYGVGVKDGSAMLSDQEVVKLLHNALDEGINFFDTARLYGKSERLIGSAFKDRRQRIVLGSKCRHLRQADGQLMPYALLERYIRDSLYESLRLLQTDYIDLYMVHYADETLLGNDELARVFMQLKKEGLVRAIGVSVYKVEETRLAIEAGIWDTIQLPFNLMDQSHGAYFDAAVHKGIGIIVRSVLMRGMLTERAEKLHPALHDVELHIRRYQPLLACKFNGLSQFATQFALSHEAVSAVLVGIDKQRYLKEAIACATGRYFDNKLLKQVQGMAYPDPEFLNMAAWDKNGWL